MRLNIKNEIRILYDSFSGECRETYFETKRSGGNDEQTEEKPGQRRLQVLRFIKSIHTVGFQGPH